MELLTSRRFWSVVGLLAAVGLTAWLYTRQPWPSPLSWLIDGAAIIAMFFGGLTIISQFVLPVQTMAERQHVLRHFISYALGSHGPIIFVKEGKLVARKEELSRFFAEGVALLDSSSAIVLERAYAPHWWFARQQPGSVPLVRAAGPGIVFIQPGERIVATLDLRRQSRSATAKALTRDGIEVSANVSVTFGLSYEPPPASQADDVLLDEMKERNRPARLFDPDRAFRSVYGTALGEKQPVAWTELPVSVAVETFRNLLAEYTLDSLFQPTAPGAYPYGDFQARVTARVKEAQVLADRGLIIFTVGVGALKLPREVVNQRVRNWQARWQKAVIQNYAAGKGQAIQTQGRWQIEAQDNILETLKAKLEQAASPAAKRALALALITALQRATADPLTRQLVPKENLRTLESLPDWLKG